MPTTLKILFVEDSEDDSLLILEELRRSEYDPEWRRVDRLVDFRHALESSAWDAVICDYNLPEFDAPAALSVMREKGIDIPFIVVSGAVTEEIAVRTMKAGAQDFCSKHNLARLAPALGRELRESRERVARREAEKALESSRAHVRLLLESRFIAVFFADEAGRLLEANAAFSELLGYDTEDVRTGQVDWSKLVPPGIPFLTPGALRELHDTRRLAPMEKDLVRKDGSLLHAVMGGAVLEEEKNRFIGFILDVSRLKKTEAALQKSEEQLRQSQKMEAIGKLAGGIAHDFNNLLTAINGYSSLALAQIEKDHPLQNALHEINKAGERAAALTQQLLAYSRKQVMAPKRLNLNDALSEMHNLLSRLIGEDIDLLMNLHPDIGLIKADPGQLQQVILNLVVNARDAMPEGGTIIVETAKARLDETYVRKRPAVLAGEYLQLSVSDTGLGMDSATRERIFEPFFTTKAVGQGSGLGLSMVDGIISQSGGYIFVYSEAGIGTTFKIYLPIDSGEESETSRSSGAMATNGHGDETILLVEDEKAVRQFARRVLEMNGYTVLEAVDGRDALKVLESSPGPLHLLLTDVVMPRMNGRLLAEEVVSRSPDTAVIFMSGYTDDAILRHGLLHTTAQFLQKPFSAQKLVKLIRESLDLGPQSSGGS